jgi:hypothetical protein
MTFNRPKVLLIGIGVLSAMILTSDRSQSGTTLLPPGTQCFQTANGPVSSGSMNMYIPGTTTPKSTWQDPYQNALNNQPLQLDSNGCAIIYGVGTYRQQLWTGPVVGGLTSGNMVWDLLTTDTSAGNSWYWAGLATGSGNAITLNDTGFTPTSGSNIQFVPSAANTGPVTIKPYPAATAIQVVIDTAGGPQPLVGGELGANNIANVVYDATANAFHLQNPLASSAVVGIPVGGEISCAGFNPPTGFLFEYGQGNGGVAGLSRATYPTLLAALTSTQSVALTSGSTTVTAPAGGSFDVTQLAVGMAVESTGNISPSTTIATVTPSTSTITLNNPALTGGTQLLTFFAYGNGDGSTTFSLPDRRGALLYGRNNMGGTALTGIQSLSSTYTAGNPNTLGSNLHAATVGIAGGAIGLAATNIPTLTINTFTPTVATSGAYVGTTTEPNMSSGGIVTPIPAAATTLTMNAVSGVTTSGTSGTSFSIVSPGQTTNWCIRAK